MSVCQRCNSKLVTEGLLPGQQYRCANCQWIARFGETEKVPANKLAWRSLWLGLASIVLIFFTGIPAMYYGIRSLLRMRFVKSKPSDRAAAIVGTAFGGCFGVCIGGFVAMIGAIILFSFLTHTETTEPDDVALKCEQVFDLELPDGFIPVKAESVMGMQHSFDFADEKRSIDRSARIHLKFLGSNMKTNENRLIESLASKSPNHHSLGQTASTEILEWEMGGEPIDVKKSIFEASTEHEDSKVIHQYFGLHRTDHGYYGATVVFEPEDFELTEDDVKKFFAGLGPAKPKMDIQAISDPNDQSQVND